MRLARRCLIGLFGIVLGLQAGTAVRAQDYPARQVVLIAPWPAGGAIDALCRTIGPGLNDRLGKSIVIENRPGAGSVIGTAAVAKAAPDGYTLVMAGSGSLAISPMLFKKLAYDPKTDFAPVALVAQIPFVLVVNPSLPVTSVPELIRYSKENPGKLSYASGGPGSPHHLYAEILKSMTGIEMTHVPYKGSAPALTDVVAGHVPLMFSDPVPALPLVKEGKVRALGVTSAQRLPSAPDIPPLTQAGVPGFEVAGWGMIVAPAGTPKEVVSRLHADIKSVVALPGVQRQIVTIGMVPLTSPPPEALQDFINAEILRWGKAVQQAGLAGSEG